jgi:DNA repair exonuclease SbcCD ATPase subunit/DNA repair exonuclease SbcCD nuclease subunit
MSKQSIKIALKPKIKTENDWIVKHLSLDFKRIYHLSDIHIRPLQRHPEFQQVFDRVKSTLESDQGQGSIAVITGDIFDNKTVFRPETFQLCRDFFKMIAKIMPVVVIAGNHDMMESNMNRLDSITPIVDGIANLHYLKYSGLYFCKNSVCFVVSSLYDKTFIHYRDIVNSPHYQKDHKYVALYHGTLNGATNDAGYVMESDDGQDEPELEDQLSEGGSGSSRYRSIKDFDNFDAVLLGDIHKHQIMKGTHGTIAYAGSLIQQNHGENLGGHGILVWDENWSCKLLPICNDYGFVDIHCQDGEWINRDVTLPKNCYARLVIKNCTETQVNVIITTLKGFVDTLNITKRQCINDNIDEFEIPPDIKRKEDEIELIQEQATINKYDADRLIALHRSYQTELDMDQTCMSTAVWRPINIEFKNMFGYGDNALNKINFKQGITCITAGNACGKTSIVNIILFSIFGRTPLNPSNTTYTFDIINNNQTSGYVRILLNHGGQYYLIERKTVRQNNKSTTSQMLQKLSKYDFSCTIWESNIRGDKLKNCSETRKNNNDTFILELFGDITDFSLSNLLNKESSLDLLSMPSSKQVDVLKKLFKLEIYDSYKELNKTKLRAIEDDIKAHRIKKHTYESLIDKSITSEHVETLQQEILQAETRLSEMNDLKKLLQDDKHTFMHTMQQYENSLIDVDTSDLPTDLDLIYRELQIMENNIPEDTGIKGAVMEYKLQDLQRQIDTVAGNLSALNDLPSLNELNEDLKILKQQKITYGSFDDRPASDLHRELGKISSRLEYVKETLSGYGDDDEFECIESIADLKSQLVSLTSDYTAVKQRLDALILPDIEIDPDININIINRNRMELSRIKSELNILELKRDKDYSVPELKLKELEMQLIPNIPILRYDVSEDQLQQLKNQAHNQTIELQQSPIRMAVQIVEDLQECPCDKDIVHMPVSLRTDIVDHLKNGDEIRKLELSYGKTLDQLDKLEMQLSINSKIEHNNAINAKIAQVQYISGIDTVNALEKTIATHELMLASKLLFQEYDYLCAEEEKHINNGDIKSKITQLEHQKRKTELDKELVKLEAQYDQVNSHLNYLDIIHDINVINEDILAHEQANRLNHTLQKLHSCREETQVQLDMQDRYDRYLFLKDINSRRVLIDKNHETQIQIDKTKTILNEIIEDISVQNEDINTLTTELNSKINRMTVISYRLQEQQQHALNLQETETALIQLERDIVLYQHYNIIMGNKGITSKLLFNKINSIKDYINTIIQQFTKYTIHILYDEQKQNISILTENKTDGKFLSTTRLSGYEKLMLQIAFKRALNKFSYNSKSSLIIIDEALDCIDQENFLTRLPEVMNLITQDYSNCLAISQRDISHISDHVVTIKRQNGGSIIA